MSISNNIEELKIENLSYVDIQHDTLNVFDDVEQGIINSEDIWISGYKFGETSIHGKAKIKLSERGGSEIIPRDNNVEIERINKTQFKVSIPKLLIQNRTIKFPKQIIYPPYKKSSNLDAPLHINSISLNPNTPHIVIGGQDGYCTILSTTLNSSEKQVQLKGHVGDVLDVKWFPSGEVILTCSSDLSIRIYGKEGINPRTLKGHTKTITSTYIIGIGKEIITSSKDGNIKLWDISKGKEIKNWLIGKSIEQMIIIDNSSIINKFNLKSERIGLLNVQNGIWIQPLNNNNNIDEKGWFIENEIKSKLISISYDENLLVKGYMNGLIEIIKLDNLINNDINIIEKGKRNKIIKRNESSIYSLNLKKNNNEGYNLYIGTLSGLPALIFIKEINNDEFEIEIKEELASWNSECIETFDIGKEGIWCSGGEGVLKRY
ncbi:uncharacterized protein I206_103632 [Kwoniella pini CBS 10737]|uniref:Uncharacterized protein n=1 Tax=Kwoniella pini CBS 10737 TaxID=1296096 RepID=A0A1B9I9N2_9TREE|nr:uncharacterized protein I206_01366 [Kwoniella pini CBS 10737]OCF52081.1 hypothetical protein I206_01366 [Kwoniella pini CBS 10737]